MSIYKCKMCGGNLDVTQGATVVECEYCGTKQTVPTTDNEKKVNLFNRANRLRIGGEFDKAAVIYESIIAEFPEEAEAYWGLCLCNYGIEYVDDPSAAKKIPTCHRASFESVQKDENFNLALEYADVVAQKVYRDEAREIDRIMSEILAISKNEKPYDVFICYKETDEKGERTVDSVLAQDIYDALTAKGMKVFFARITLEDKLGRQYEPYIFAALNSAKVMLAVGTKYEYYNAVWVKNEWSRFLKLMAKDKSKALIPCYKDLDAYDMPEEFKMLQAQDLGKIGAVQDIVHGVEKLTNSSAKKAESAAPASVTVDSYMRRIYAFLGDENWRNAEIYCERILDVNVEYAEAYLGKLMAQLKAPTIEKLSESSRPLEQFNEYSKILRYGDEALKNQITAINNEIIENNKYRNNLFLYTEALQSMKAANTVESCFNTMILFKQLGDFKISEELCRQCFEKGAEIKANLEKQLSEYLTKWKADLETEEAQVLELNEVIEKNRKKIKRKVKEKDRIGKIKTVVLSLFALYFLAMIAPGIACSFFPNQTIETKYVVIYYSVLVALLVLIVGRKLIRKSRNRRLISIDEENSNKMYECNAKISELTAKIRTAETRYNYLSSKSDATQFVNAEYIGDPNNPPVKGYVFKGLDILEADAGYFKATYRKRGNRFNHKTCKYVLFLFQVENCVENFCFECSWRITGPNGQKLMDTQFGKVQLTSNTTFYTDGWGYAKAGNWKSGRYNLVFCDKVGNVYTRDFYID